MDSKSPTEILEAEHHVIQKVVGAMAVLAEGLGAGQEPPVETLRNIVEFMRTFADKCHHGKEEVHLFSKHGKRWTSTSSRAWRSAGFRRAGAPWAF